MNRAKRRQLDRVIKQIDNPVKYELTSYQIEQIKKDATQKAVETIEENLIKVMFSLPILVAHWEFGFGPKRCERLANRICEEYVDKFKEGDWTPNEFVKAVGDLTGVIIK